MKIKICYKIFACFLVIIFLTGCTKATKTLIIFNTKFPAILEPTKDINIIKIDKRMVEVSPYNTTGTQYFKAALEPGKHKVVVSLPWFDTGNVRFLKFFAIGGRKYLVKQKVGNRSGMLSNEWAVAVWIEDAETGEIVSATVKNI